MIHQKAGQLLMQKKPTPPLTGRPVSDEIGNQTWQWDAQGEIDTAVVRALGETLALDESGDGRPTNGSNPYDQTLNPASALPSQRRTLDDMRNLSDEIKRAKHWKRDR
jgi:hypothetical protein